MVNEPRWDPGMRPDDLTMADLEEEDRRRSRVTVGQMAEAEAREAAAAEATDRPPVVLRPMFPDEEDSRGRKRS